MRQAEQVLLRAAFVTGLMVFVGAVVGTFGEYVTPLLIRSGGWPIILAIGAGNALLIFYYFMHGAWLWRRKRGEEE